MNDEAFLAAIAADPDEDVHRLVYADWLDDHGDSARAEFLRRDVELCRTPHEGPRTSEEQALLGLWKELDPTWRERASRPRDLVLIACESAKKIPTIKTIRTLRFPPFQQFDYWGLKAAKEVWEAAPSVVLFRVGLGDAERGRDLLLAAAGAENASLEVRATTWRRPGYDLLVTYLGWHDEQRTKLAEQIAVRRGLPAGQVELPGRGRYSAVVFLLETVLTGEQAAGYLPFDPPSTLSLRPHR